MSLSLCFLGCMIYLYVHVCFVLPWSVESFPFMFYGRWHNKLKWTPFEFFAPSQLLRVRSWLHPFKGHCEQQAMRDEGVIYVAGHPLLNRRCTRLPGVSASEMTYIVSGGALNSTHSFSSKRAPYKVAGAHFWPVCDNYNLKLHKYVCITTNQPGTKSNPNLNPNPNPTAKQHAINNEHLTMSYVSRLIYRRLVVAPPLWV